MKELAHVVTMRYKVVAVGVTVADVEVAPAIFVQVVPPLIDCCHWYKIPLPLLSPAEFRVTLAPAQPLFAEMDVVPVLGVPEQAEAGG